MNVHIRTTSALAAGLASIMTAGCAATTVQTDKDARVNLTEYETFDVRSGQVLNNGMLDKRDTLVRDRVESALSQKLQQKGLEPVAQNPDLIATYTAGAQSGLEWNNLGGVSYGDYQGTTVEDYTEGTLLIDLIDPKTNKLVWRSIVKMEDEDLRSAKNIKTAVDEGLEKYPGAR